MKNKRRIHSAEFKALMALEAVKGGVKKFLFRVGFFCGFPIFNLQDGKSDSQSE